MKLCRTAFTFVICLFVPAHGQSCSCRGGCDNTTLVFPGSDGKIVDVAYGKPATMSSTYYSSREGPSGPACMAVNGKTGTEYRTLRLSNPNCFHTAANDTNDWWEVDLGRNHTVTNITIYRRAGLPRRMSGIHVEVDNQTCYTFPLLVDNAAALLALPEKIDVTCTPPLTGRVVRLQKRRQWFDYWDGAHLINICEVQVWGCRDGLYGADCVEQCGHCADSITCNTLTGHCPRGCQPGWKGDNCKQECDDGKYGNDCSSSCGHCNTGDVCHHIFGTCPSGCAAGFEPSDPRCERMCTGNRYGASCDLNCSTKCGGDGSCETDTGRCVEGCVAGYRPGQSGFCNYVCEEGKYGEGCLKECGKCTHSCRHNDGLCIGGCFDGYAAPYCAQTSESIANLAVPVAGTVFGGLCVVALSILIVGLLIRRSRKCSSSETASPPPTSAYQSFELGAPLDSADKRFYQRKRGMQVSQKQRRVITMTGSKLLMTATEIPTPHLSSRESRTSGETLTLTKTLLGTPVILERTITTYETANVLHTSGNRDQKRISGMRR